MNVTFSHSELAALRLAAGLSDYGDVETFVREVVMQAVHRLFDDGVTVVPVGQPVRGRDILSIHAQS